MKKQIYIISTFLLIIIALFVIAPDIAIKACFSGINVWATNLLPALLPFFFFTRILSELGMITELSKGIAPITRRLYNTSGISGYVYLMSVMSGYPVGAKITSDLYENKIIDVYEAHRIVSFTSTSGPLFILGTVGIGMYNSKLLGYVVLISHFLGALLNGLLYRNYKVNETNDKVLVTNLPSKNLLEDCMINSIKSILIVGGYVSIFFMIITILNYYNIFFPIEFIIEHFFPAVNYKVINAMLNGALELTRGCLDLSFTGLSMHANAVLLSALVSFGGFSINLQALTFLKKMNISFKFYFMQKITHTIISILIAFVLGFIML